MTASDTRSELARFNAAILRDGLAIGVQGIVLKRLGGGGALVTWSSAIDAVPFNPSDAFGAIEEYLRLVREQQYTAVLNDGALLQLSYGFDRADIVTHRLCYYPCPVILSRADVANLEEISLLELVTSYVLKELTRLNQDPKSSDEFEDAGGLRLRSPIRFDYDIQNKRAGHPGSHLHLSQETVRWAVFGPLSVGHFARFVVRHFYPEVWDSSPTLREWPLRWGTRCIEPSEERELYVECVA